MAKTWKQKYDSKPNPEIKIIEKDFWGQRAGDRMLIPTPKLIEDYLRETDSGTVIDIVQLRKDLASKQGADFSCPMTTSIFLRIMAETQLELYGTNTAEMAPFWRVIDLKSPLAKKLSCGVEFLNTQLEKEQS